MMSLVLHVLYKTNTVLVHVQRNMFIMYLFSKQVGIELGWHDQK